MVGETNISAGMPVALTDTPPDVLAAFLKNVGEPDYRVDQIYRWLYRDMAADFHEMSNIPFDLRKALAAHFRVHGLGIESVHQSAGDSTQKFFMPTSDGSPVEAVLLPRRRGFALCISSQSGCGMACPFCATGTLGLIRNLTVGEIVDQFLHGRRTARDLGSELNSVIFMGMGEPLANIDNVEGAISRLVDTKYAGFGARRITVSTIGLPGRIPRVALWPWQIGLAISLHAPEDGLRRRLVPASHALPLHELMRDAISYQELTGRRVTYEYVLLGNVNDSLDEAHTLGCLLQGQLCHVNLIPYNPVNGLDYSGATTRDITKFRDALESCGIAVTIRRPRGCDIDAACGQLSARHNSFRDECS